MDSPCSMPDPLSLLRNKNTPDTTSPSSCASPITIMGINLPKFDNNAHPFAESILSQRWSVHQRLGKILLHKHNLQPRGFLTAFESTHELLFSLSGDYLFIVPTPQTILWDCDRYSSNED